MRSGTAHLSATHLHTMYSVHVNHVNLSLSRLLSCLQQSLKNPVDFLVLFEVSDISPILLAAHPWYPLATVPMALACIWQKQGATLWALICLELVCQYSQIYWKGVFPQLNCGKKQFNSDINFALTLPSIQRTACTFGL